ncbi:hypothetical protein WAI453_004877 [Rhynchosporium graminicola]|uniref:Uncharacterized protein n=1 Tax=Rhynchosporium graminicola TaxID=2792576 RepID=A0A1E1LSS1_9HELO|nr:uncharacterized protein RCO7_10379 [Rhynchosporium commune]
MDRFLSSTLEFLEWLVSLPKQGYVNLTRNAVHMWDDMSMLNYIRMIAIVGGYLFIRPYLQRYGERQQAKQLAKLEAERKGPKSKAKISPNALRDGGGKGKSVKFADERAEGSSEDREKGGKGEVEEWGKKAKKRQKKVQDLLAKEGQRLEDLDDKEDLDIMEYLVDYEEGKDGW